MGDTGRTLFVLLGAVGLLLLVACANVAVLSLARGLERGPEASIRLALGATRGRLAPAVPRGVAAARRTRAAPWARSAPRSRWRCCGRPKPTCPASRRSASTRSPSSSRLPPTAACALVAGLPYAWRRARGAGGRTSWKGRHRRPRGRRVSASATPWWSPRWRWPWSCSPGAGLLVRSYERLQSQDPGLRAQEACSWRPSSSTWRPTAAARRRRAYYARLFERLEALPGVVSVGAATALPTSPLGPDFERPVWPEERPDDERARRQAWVRMVTPRYFETLGIRVLRGPRLRGRATGHRRRAR